MKNIVKDFKRQDTEKDLGDGGYINHPKIVRFAMFISYLNWIVAIALPLAYWNAANKNGFPWDPHIIFAVYCFLIVLFELCVALTVNPGRFFSSCDYACFCGFGWVIRDTYLLFVGMLSRGDVYTDGTFLVVAYHTPDTKLFVPALVMYLLGIVLFQFIIEGGFFLWILCHVESQQHATNLLFRHGDIVLVMDMFGSQRLQDKKERDCIVSTCRFCCEDISQTIIQVLFLLEDHESSDNNDLIMISIVIAITLSALKFLTAGWQCFTC